MPEYIERKALLKEAESRIMWGASAVAVYESIEDAPAAVDAVEVVRCRECKKNGLSAFYPDSLFCREHGRYVDPDGYCYLGELKEGADNG